MFSFRSFTIWTCDMAVVPDLLCWLPPYHEALFWGPLVFLIYVNHLPTKIQCTVKLLADDFAVYQTITNSSDNAMLQIDLDNFSSWCSDWLMKLNVTKWECMRISRHSSDPNPVVHAFNTSARISVTSYKYLGVHITDSLWCNLQVEFISSNANRMLGFLRRNF